MQPGHHETPTQGEHIIPAAPHRLHRLRRREGDTEGVRVSRPWSGVSCTGGPVAPAAEPCYPQSRVPLNAQLARTHAPGELQARRHLLDVGPPDVGRRLVARQGHAERDDRSCGPVAPLQEREHQRVAPRSRTVITRVRPGYPASRTCMYLRFTVAHGLALNQEFREIQSHDLLAHTRSFRTVRSSRSSPPIRPTPSCLPDGTRPNRGMPL
ncbi:hypothetical protein BC628DRAFT_675337 [Trametes gibbosa]|nr:hypothetical protein BC628DRAFT_675337 [Trametes gibbosa]